MAPNSRKLICLNRLNVAKQQERDDRRQALPIHKFLSVILLHAVHLCGHRSRSCTSESP
jgi:hypothetical protein